MACVLSAHHDGKRVPVMMTFEDSLHVVAAVLRKSTGEVLLARRPAGSEDAGYWEFPGGKRESGESAHAALQRELREELGVQIERFAPLMRIPQQQAGRHLVLDVWLADGEGLQPQPLLGQQLAWQHPAQIDPYSLPAADRPALAALEQPGLYAITPDFPDGDSAVASVLACIAQFQRSGIQRLQVRLPQLSLDRRAMVLSLVQQQFHGEVLCNARDAADMGLAERAGVGLHLSQSLLQSLSKRPTGFECVVGSVHDVDALRHAERLSLDAAVLGPIKPTRTHPEVTAIGWHGFVRLREQSALPMYALGGLCVDDLAIARQHGAQGIAAIRGFVKSDPA